MLRRVPLVLCSLVVLASACTSVNPNPEEVKKPPIAAASSDEFTTSAIALTLSASKEHEPCTGIGDPSCNAQGPGGLAKVCNLEKKLCMIMKDVDTCVVPDVPVDDLSCGWIPCNVGDSCNDGSVATKDFCQPTDALAAKGYDGLCTNFWTMCKVAEGSPCQAEGPYIVTPSKSWCDATALKPVNPTELCDGVDNDCNGVVDDGFNADSSKFDIGLACDGTDTDKCQKGKWTCTANKMGSECENETAHLVEACDGDDNDCDGVVDDKWAEVAGGKVTACDGDDADTCANGAFMCNGSANGVVCVEVDKNVVEVCDGKDDTCEGTTDEGCDKDDDKYCDKNMSVRKGALCSKSTIPSDNSTIAGDDCNDNPSGGAGVNPGAAELCDAKDQNCNSQTDEGFSINIACKSDEGLTPSHGVCQTNGFWQCSAEGNGVICSATVDLNKKSTEICNGLDDDCDGTTDEGCDDDLDLYCDATMLMAQGAKCSKSVLSVSGATAGDDCNDMVKDINYGATEICDGKDNNCGGSTDEGCDNDADGFCDAAMTYASGAVCSLGGVGGNVGDCNDEVASINPGASDGCNGKDDNCDGKTDIAADNSSSCSTLCSNAVKIKCGDTVSLSMISNPFKGKVLASSYKCYTSGTSTYTYTPLAANDLYVVFDCAGVSKVNVSVKAPGGETGSMFALTGCDPTSGAYNESQCAKRAVFYSSSKTGAYTATLLGINPTKQMLGFDAATDIGELVVTVNPAP